MALKVAAATANVALSRGSITGCLCMARRSQMDSPFVAASFQKSMHDCADMMGREVWLLENLFDGGDDINGTNNA